LFPWIIAGLRRGCVARNLWTDVDASLLNLEIFSIWVMVEQILDQFLDKFLWISAPKCGSEKAKTSAPCPPHQARPIYKTLTPQPRVVSVSLSKLPFEISQNFSVQADRFAALLNCG
jgi:hypothetical protein